MNAIISFAANKYSQSGEDGVLEEIFRALDIKTGTFCEFGAWDGTHLSNCRALYDLGWGGWYIEGSTERFKDLQRNITESRVENICSFVQPDGPNSLDALLTGSKLFAEGVKSLDLLSIDIDSDDLAVWRGVKAFRPKVVIIEFNPTIPSDVFFENTRGKNYGNSPRSIYEFANTNGYYLVAVIGANLVFIDKAIGSPVPEIAFEAIGPRYFFGYDGTLFVSQAGANSAAKAPEAIKVPWNGGVFSQPVSRMFRSFDQPYFMQRIQKMLSYAKHIICRPLSW